MTDIESAWASSAEPGHTPPTGGQPKSLPPAPCAALSGIPPNPPYLAEWHSIARIYQCATAIYCIATLLQDDKLPELENGVEFSPGQDVLGPPEEARCVIATARRPCQSMLVRLLRSIRPSTHLRKLCSGLLWWLGLRQIILRPKLLCCVSWRGLARLR